MAASSGRMRKVASTTVLHELVLRYAQTLLAELRDADGRNAPYRHWVSVCGSTGDAGSPAYVVVDQPGIMFVPPRSRSSGMALARCGVS